MTKMTYRGVAYDTDQKKAEERVFRRPQLVYRGVEHNGVRTHDKPKHAEGFLGKLIYRGYQVN